MNSSFSKMNYNKSFTIWWLWKRKTIFFYWCEMKQKLTGTPPLHLYARCCYFWTAFADEIFLWARLCGDDPSCVIKHCGRDASWLNQSFLRTGLFAWTCGSLDSFTNKGFHKKRTNTCSILFIDRPIIPAFSGLLCPCDWNHIGHFETFHCEDSNHVFVLWGQQFVKTSLAFRVKEAICSSTPAYRFQRIMR